MLIRDSATCPRSRVMDRSLLCELLHPARDTGAEELPCSIAHAIVPAGESTLPHRLTNATELYFVLSGTGRVHIGREAADLLPGQIVRIPPQAVQYIENTGPCDLVFLCIVAPPWHEEDEELA